MNFVALFLARCGLGPAGGGKASIPPRHRAAMFVTVWTLAILATVLAFVLHLALRGRTVSLGYELGRARSEQARLREVKRVLEVEAASYKTPERVEIVARTLLGMEPPAADRMIVLPAVREERQPSPSSSPPGGAPSERGDGGSGSPNQATVAASE